MGSSTQLLLYPCSAHTRQITHPRATCHTCHRWKVDGFGRTARPIAAVQHHKKRAAHAVTLAAIAISTAAAAAQAEAPLRLGISMRRQRIPFPAAHQELRHSMASSCISPVLAHAWTSIIITDVSTRAWPCINPRILHMHGPASASCLQAQAQATGTGTGSRSIHMEGLWGKGPLCTAAAGPLRTHALGWT